MNQNNIMSMILGYTPEGSRMVKNQDGTYSTERTATESDPRLNGGRWTNFPTLVNGRQLDPDTALQRAVMSPKQYPNFDTLQQAEAAAQQRTGLLGQLIRNYETQTAMPRSILDLLIYGQR